jgi:hypothetical protein
MESINCKIITLCQNDRELQFANHVYVYAIVHCFSSSVRFLFHDVLCLIQLALWNNKAHIDATFGKNCEAQTRLLSHALLVDGRTTFE